MADLLKAARNALSFASWKADDIGSGAILQHLINAAEVESNNLFIQDGRYGEDKRKQQLFYNAQSSPNETVRLERLFYDFYFDHLPESQLFVKLAEEQNLDYRFICYWYFLKDHEKYNPISQNKFNRICEKVGCHVRLSSKKDWYSYMQLNQMIREVGEWLSEKLGEEVSMMEAHGFLWMLTYEEFPHSKYKKIDNYYRIKNITKNSILWSLRTIDEPPLNNKQTKEDYEEYKTAEDFLTEFLRRQELGKASEELAIAFEKKRLVEAGREDLVPRMNTDRRFDPKQGYDIQSFETDDERVRMIEVKTVRKRGNDFYSFFISANELNKAITSGNYWFYLVENPMSDNFVVSAIKASEILDAEECKRQLGRTSTGSFNLQPLQFLVNFWAIQGV